MPTLVRKIYADNVAGEFFVDDNCIDCDLCRQTAPKFFKRKLRGIDGHSFVYNQPRTVQEEELCNDAMRACPVEAIGKN